MKLELKHLAPYLPYRLKLIVVSNQDNGLIGEMIFLHKDYLGTNVGIKHHLKIERGLEHIKPILRPLADIDKEIDINGWFIPFDDIYLHPYRNDTKEELKEKLQEPNVELSYWIMEKLFEWHFDVFGLIEKGLAIDINNLNS